MTLPWNQLHAKVAAAFGSGAVAAVVLWLLTIAGFHPSNEVSDAITLLVAVLGGYLTPTPASQATVVTNVPTYTGTPLPPAS